MKNKQYSTEIKTRAVELLIDSQKDYPKLWSAIYQTHLCVVFNMD